MQIVHENLLLDFSQGFCTNPECVQPIRREHIMNTRAWHWVPRPPSEFSGIVVAPAHPLHVPQLIDHIAHLEEEQWEKARTVLNNWKEAADARAN